MPRPILNLSQRTTKDLHADWWSPECDETTGRYKERVVIYAQFLQADQQALMAELVGNLQLDGAALARVQQGDTSAFNIDLSQAVQQSELLFDRFVVEMTDETGAAQPLGPSAFGGLTPQDADFIVGEINKLQTAIVQPSAKDREIAASKSANGQNVSAEAQAHDSFRGDGETALAG